MQNSTDAKIKIVFEADTKSIDTVMDAVKQKADGLDVAKPMKALETASESAANSVQSVVKELDRMDGETTSEGVRLFLKLRDAIDMTAKSTQTQKEKLESIYGVIKTMVDAGQMNNEKAQDMVPHLERILDLIEMTSGHMPELQKNLAAIALSGGDVYASTRLLPETTKKWQGHIKECGDQYEQILRVIGECNVEAAGLAEQASQVHFNDAGLPELSTELDDMLVGVGDMPGMLGRQVPIWERIKNKSRDVLGNVKNLGTSLKRNITSGVGGVIARFTTWAAVAGVVLKTITKMVGKIIEMNAALKTAKQAATNYRMQSGNTWGKNEYNKKQEYEFVINQDREGDDKISLDKEMSTAMKTWGGETWKDEKGNVRGKKGMQAVAAVAQIGLANDSSGGSIGQLMDIYAGAKKTGSMDEKGFDSLMELAPQMLSTMKAQSGMNEEELREKAKNGGIDYDLVDRTFQANANENSTKRAFNQVVYEEGGGNKATSDERLKKYKKYDAANANGNVGEWLEDEMEEWVVDGVGGFFADATGGDSTGRTKAQRQGIADGQMTQTITSDNIQNEAAYEKKRKERLAYAKERENSVGRRAVEGVSSWVGGGIQSMSQGIANAPDQAQNWWDRRVVRNNRNEERTERSQARLDKKEREKAEQKKEFDKIRRGQTRKREEKERSERRAQRVIDRANKANAKDAEKKAQSKMKEFEQVRQGLGKTVNIKGLQQKIQDKLVGGENSHETQVEALARTRNDALQDIKRNTEKLGYQ